MVVTVKVRGEEAPRIVRVSCITMCLVLIVSATLFDLSESIDYLTGAPGPSTISNRLCLLLLFLLFRTLVLFAGKILIALAGINATPIASVIKTTSSWAS